MNIFDKFNEQVDIEELNKEIEATGTNDGTDYVDVPHGKYEVKITKLELTKTKKLPERPMLTVWFRVLEGEYKNQTIFMNQVVVHPYSIKTSMDFLESLDSEIEVEFGDYTKFAIMILKIAEDIEDKKEYGLDYGVNDKGFDLFEITDVFDI